MNFNFEDVKPKYDVLLWTHNAGYINLELCGAKHLKDEIIQQLNASEIFSCVIECSANSFHLVVKNSYDTLQIAERISLCLEEKKLKVERHYCKGGREPMSVQSFLLV